MAAEGTKTHIHNTLAESSAPYVLRLASVSFAVTMSPVSGGSFADARVSSAYLSVCMRELKCFVCKAVACWEGWCEFACCRCVACCG